MSLPKIGIPYYSLNLISGDVIQYRPFTVKEEKALLLANESKDKSVITNTIKNTLNSCISDSGEKKVSVEDLPMFDVENLFLNIRMRSVGEISEFNYVCEDCEGSPSVKTKIDLRNVRIENQEKGNKEKIMLTENVGIEIQNPTFKSFLSRNLLVDSRKNNSILALEMITDCIVSVFDDKQIYNRTDFSEKEIEEFVDSLTQEQLKKINDFFEKTPKLVYDLEVECPCGQVMKKKLEGISDFFS